MFRQDKPMTGKIEICCIGLLSCIAAGRFSIQGVLNEYPDVLDVETNYYLMYCPTCGELLKPEKHKPGSVVPCDKDGIPIDL